MQPKTTSSSSKGQSPSKQELEAIDKYLAQRPNFDKLLNEGPSETVAGIPKRQATEYERALKEAVAASTKQISPAR